MGGGVWVGGSGDCLWECRGGSWLKVTPGGGKLGFFLGARDGGRVIWGGWGVGGGGGGGSILSGFFERHSDSLCMQRRTRHLFQLRFPIIPFVYALYFKKKRLHQWALPVSVVGELFTDFMHIHSTLHRVWSCFGPPHLSLIRTEEEKKCFTKRTCRNSWTDRNRSLLCSDLSR